MEMKSHTSRKEKHALSTKRMLRLPGIILLMALLLSSMTTMTLPSQGAAAAASLVPPKPDSTFPTAPASSVGLPPVQCSFAFSRWHTVSPLSDWSFVAGDFTGDSLADIVGYYADMIEGRGFLRVGTNTGSGFTFSLWAEVRPSSGWSFVAGDFAGDLRADIVGYHPSNGSLWVGTSTGTCP